MPNNYQRKTNNKNLYNVCRLHLCPFCGSYVTPFLGELGEQHKGHCPKCETVTYVSMPETVTYEFTSFVKDELAAEQHKALQIVLDVASVSVPAWMTEAQAQAADAQDWQATRDGDYPR